MAKKALYWDWVREEAAKIKSDGCSGVPDFYLEACLQHDLAYFYAKNPRSAYTYWLKMDSSEGNAYWNNIEGNTYWKLADPMFQSEADAQFRKAIQKRSRLGVFSPMSWWRWLGLKVFGKKAWNRHKDTH